MAALVLAMIIADELIVIKIRFQYVKFHNNRIPQNLDCRVISGGFSFVQSKARSKRKNCVWVMYHV